MATFTSSNKNFFSRNSYVFPIWIFIFETEYAQINSVGRGVAGEGDALNIAVYTNDNSQPVSLIPALIYNESLIPVANLPPVVNVNPGKEVTVCVTLTDLLVNDIRRSTCH